MLDINHNSQILMEELVKVLEGISDLIYHKTLSYQAEDIQHFIHQEECRVLYLIDILDKSMCNILLYQLSTFQLILTSLTLFVLCFQSP